MFRLNQTIYDNSIRLKTTITPKRPPKTAVLVEDVLSLEDTVAGSSVGSTKNCSVFKQWQFSEVKIKLTEICIFSVKQIKYFTF